MSLGISILGCQRPHCLLNLLSSLNFQSNFYKLTEVNYAIQNNCHIWLDKPKLGQNIPLWKSCLQIVSEHQQFSFDYFDHKYDIKKHYGVSNAMIQFIIPFMLNNYEIILFIEDDAFLTRHAIKQFWEKATKFNDNNVFSIYGDSQQEKAPNFHSIAWMTTKERLEPIYNILKTLNADKNKWQNYLNNHNDKFYSIHPHPNDYYKGSVQNKQFMWGMMMCYICIVEGFHHQRTRDIVVCHTGIEDEFAVNARGIKHGDENGRHVDPKLAWLYY